jgi:tetratricopeptide (TPR) repeat protein
VKTNARLLACAAVLILSLGGRTLLHGADARSAYLDGAAAQGREDFALAVEKYKEALSLNPAYLEPMAGLAEAFFRMEEYEEASTYIAMARTYDRNSPDLAVLEGRIRIGQGNVPAARALFNAVLQAQPNNVEARLGIAEADIADGKPQTALDRYAQTLKLAPESSRAILSLATLSDESGDFSRAGSFYELALKSHSSDPLTQLAAASWYASRGNFSAAEKHARISLSLKPGLDRARILLGRIYLQTARYADAISELREVVTANRDNSLAWYSLALAYRKSGDAAKAIASFASGLLVRAEDEVARIGQEATAAESLPMGDAQRQKMGAYHFAEGRAFEDRSFLEKALAEYRRALILDPTSSGARVAYARIYKSLGFPAKYLSELQVLARLGTKDTFVTDEIERMTSAFSESVSRAWAYDQYNLERARYSIPVYTLPAGNRLVHSLASEDLAKYFASLLGRFDSISAPDTPPAVTGFDQAFRSARTAGNDYFILLAFDEADRSFAATVDLYLARTGARIASFAAFRTGNGRVRDSLMRLAAQVAELLPVEGTLLIRKFGQGAIDLGSFQGVKKGDVLVIVRKGEVRLRSDGPGMSYSESAVVGDFRITGLDEAVSEGTVTGRGYFDYVNAGDHVLFPVKKVETPVVSPAQRSPNILSRIFGIGG